jgi:hypothetical protein
LVRKWSYNLLLLAVVLILTVALGEALLRLVLRPGDYLAPSMVADDTLGYLIRPGSAGHDAWGFRNAAVPDSVDIVTLGDSQTYGWMAAREQSWPTGVGKLAGKAVYNISLGGFGPVHYAWLLENRALRLHPRYVIAGFYFGNDLFDAFNLVYRYPYWASLRRPGLPSDTIALDAAYVLAKPRAWLSEHSVLYRLLVRFISDNLAQVKMRYFYKRDTDVTILDDPAHGVKTGLTPATWLKALDLQDPRIMEGLRLTEAAFARMDSTCRAHGLRFTVLLIPTKECVYSPCMQPGTVANHWEILQHMLQAEGEVHDSLVAFLKERNIEYTEALPALRHEIGHAGLYAADQDGHPRSYGYQVLARCVFQKLFAPATAK